MFDNKFILVTGIAFRIQIGYMYIFFNSMMGFMRYESVKVNLHFKPKSCIYRIATFTGYE